MTNRHFPSKRAEAAYHKGLDMKSDEIKEMGVEAAIEKFNQENPNGGHWMRALSVEAQWFAMGEVEAVHRHL